MILAFAWVGIGAAIGIGSLIAPYVPPQALAIPADTNQVTLFPIWGVEHRDLRTLVDSNAMREHPIRDSFTLYLRSETADDRSATRVAEAEQLVDRYITNETAARRAIMFPGVVGWVLLPPIVIPAIGWPLSGVPKGVAETTTPERKGRSCRQPPRFKGCEFCPLVHRPKSPKFRYQLGAEKWRPELRPSKAHRLPGPTRIGFGGSPGVTGSLGMIGFGGRMITWGVVGEKALNTTIPD
jgi:hypothetical protein